MFLMRQPQLASFLYAFMALEKLFGGSFQSTLNYFSIHHFVTKSPQCLEKKMEDEFTLYGQRSYYNRKTMD